MKKNPLTIVKTDLKSAFLHDMVFYWPELMLIAWICIILIFGLIYERSVHYIKLSTVMGNMTSFFLILLAIYYLFCLNKQIHRVWAFNPKSYLLFWGYDFGVFSNFNKVVCLLTASVCLLSSKNYFQEKKFYYIETVVLTLTVLLGAMTLVSSNDLLFFYISLEVMSLSLYVYIAMKKNETQAIEAALKYFILGAIASSFIVLGSALIYSIAGTTNLKHLEVIIPHLEGYRLHRYILGSIFILAGIFYKLGIFPFHYWIGDVYTGSPAPVVAVMTTLAKYPVIVFLWKFTYFVLHDRTLFFNLLVTAGIFSIIIGSFYAYGQSKTKRLIAYSSIVHSGFIVLGISTFDWPGYKSAIAYALIYILLSLSFFNFLLSNFRGRNRRMFLYLSDFADLFQQKPNVASLFTIVIFAYIGIPPLAGFFGKYLIISSIVKIFPYELSIFVVIMSLIGSIYYFRFIKNMYFNLKIIRLHEPVFSWENNTVGYLVFLFCVAWLLVGFFFLHRLDLDLHYTMHLCALW